jgi:hypothetical protein
MLWNSWAKSWGTAWAESWGPIEEQEQQVPHGGATPSAARLARKAIEEARRKSLQKQIDRDRQVTQEALDALDAERGIVEPIQDRIVPADLPEFEPLTEVESRGTIEPLPPVNDVVSRIMALGKTLQDLSITNETQTTDDEEALALIMILSELD